MKDGKQTDAKGKSPKSANLNDVSKSTKNGKEKYAKGKSTKDGKEKDSEGKSTKDDKERCQGQEH